MTVDLTTVDAAVAALDAANKAIKSDPKAATSTKNAVAAATALGDAVGIALHALSASIAAPPVPPPVVRPAGIAAFRWGGTADTSTDLNLVDLIGMDIAGDLTIGSRYPGKPIFFYRSVCSIQADEDSCIPHATCVANNWLARDSSGNLLLTGYGANVLDITNVAASQTVAAAFANWCTSHGFAGIVLDDVNRYVHSFTQGAKTPAGLSDAQWETALYAHIGRIMGALKPLGKRAIANANVSGSGTSAQDDGSGESDFITKLAAAGVTDVSPEFWEETSNLDPSNTNPMRPKGSAWNQNWDGWRALNKQCQALGIGFYPASYIQAPDDARAIYCRASFLLDWDGRSGGSVLQITSADMKTYGPVTSQVLGQPSEKPAVQVGNAWQQTYTDAAGKTHLVTVDPVAVTASIS